MGENGIVQKNGRLIFKDTLRFVKHINWVVDNQQTFEKINKFNEQLDLISLKSIYLEGLFIKDSILFKKITSASPDIFNVFQYDSAKFVELTCPNALAYIANKDGIYQIGNIVTKVSKLGFINVNYNNEDQIDKLSKMNSLNNKKELQSLLKQNNTKLTTTQTYYNTAYRDDKHRLVARGTNYSSDGFFYKESRSTTQRKHLGAWFRSDLSGNVGVSYSGIRCYKDINNQIINLPVSNSIYTSDSDIALTVFSYHVYEKINLGKSNIQVIHFGADKTITKDNILENELDIWLN